MHSQLFTWRGITCSFQGANGVSHIPSALWTLGEPRPSLVFVVIPLQDLRNWSSSDASCQLLQLVLSENCFFLPEAEPWAATHLGLF